LCGSELSEAMNQQGIQHGYLVTNTHPFCKIKIKLKKYSNKKDCGASHMLFPYELGMKFIISIFILFILIIQARFPEVIFSIH